MAIVKGIFDENTRNLIKSAKVLVVGAGGIGCELLKNLLLSGFENIDVIDLDTIDVSNLNRQFLFQKQHVGKSKAEVSKDSAQKFNPKAKITAHHDNIMKPDYSLDFFKEFSIVMNALDNRAARSHVNRMCLAADVPLVESGTAGYLGQVTVIIKGQTECYECQPKPRQKSFPGCTIRNTPSEPIHCIVWAKHLFNQLFGEADPDEDVSPDMADPELGGEAGQVALNFDAGIDGNIQRVSTRGWAESSGYNPVKIFNKLFRDDIKYLLSMDKLWQKRKPPQPLDWGELPDSVACSSNSRSAAIREQEIWSLKKCSVVFENTIHSLKKKLETLSGDHLVWDKDEEDCINFVTACANIRAFCFGISQKSQFDIKSMAGNIIPAIATTNAVIAGLLVLQAWKILMGHSSDCRTVYLNKQPNPKKKLLVPCLLDKPNPKCYVCSSKPEVSVQLSCKTLTVKTLEEQILKEQLHMVAPDVEIDDGKGTILISSEEGETEENKYKVLEEFGIKNGSRLKCDDFLQNFEVVLNIIHKEHLEDGVEFVVIGNAGEPLPEENSTELPKYKEKVQQVLEEVTEDDDLVIIEEEEVDVEKKRKHSLDEDQREEVVKKIRIS
ncbi:SUMO-activating enzyme subunit 2-like [Limulus polyphemus]|uniref:SUMO-activating enzyme subunit n=1 Tax=Limulus polyphemus TaxID=6850 RepID=A0ABM1BW27_LIMPO|nr:SUMO-activating enzyme subunit 2-like [Limulus polyphemus]